MRRRSGINGTRDEQSAFWDPTYRPAQRRRPSPAAVRGAGGGDVVGVAGVGDAAGGVGGEVVAVDLGAVGGGGGVAGDEVHAAGAEGVVADDEAVGDDVGVGAVADEDGVGGVAAGAGGCFEDVVFDQPVGGEVAAGAAGEEDVHHVAGPEVVAGQLHVLHRLGAEAFVVDRAIGVVEVVVDVVVVDREVTALEHDHRVRVERVVDFGGAEGEVGCAGLGLEGLGDLLPAGVHVQVVDGDLVGAVGVALAALPRPDDRQA